MARATIKPRKATPAGKAPIGVVPKAKVSLVEDDTPIMTAPDMASNTGPVTESEAEEEPQYKKRDLMQAVIARSAVKRSDIREVTELVLDEIGNALQAGRELNLAPLGKLSIKRRNEGSNGDVLVTRIKLTKPGTGTDRQTDEHDGEDT
jgi:nucleoid DNA-binding protein